MSELYIGDESSVLNQNTRTFEEREQELKELEEQREKAIKNARKSPYSNWLQLNKEHNKELMALSKKDPSAMCVLIFLLDNMDHYNAVTCSYDVIMNACELSKATVGRAVKTLRECKFLKIYKSGGVNSYTINKEVAWNSYGTNYKYGSFSSNVLIDTKDLDTDVKYEKKKVLKVK